MHRIFFTVATLAVAATIAWGFVLVGSPGSRRIDRFDEQRVQDLQTIQQEIETLCVAPDKKEELKGPLPKTLEEAASRAQNRRLSLTDPETGEPYGYRVTGESNFELGATFARPRTSDYSVAWDHPAGEHWFKIDVLKDTVEPKVYAPIGTAPAVQSP